MKWYKPLYVGESIKSVRFTQFQIDYRKKCKNYYCITLSKTDHALLEIYESRFFRMPGFDPDGFLILGLASNKKEAVDVVRNIIEDVYVHTHGFDIASYLNLDSQI